jgi:hypothetical protein
MPLPPCTTVFFDLASTLAFVTLSEEARVSALRVYPGVPNLLDRLIDGGARLGAIVHCGGASTDHLRLVLDTAGLQDLSSRLVVVEGAQKKPEDFIRAANLTLERDGCADARLLYVGADARDREMAKSAGFLTSPHPRLAASVLQDYGPLLYLRIRAPATRNASAWISTLESSAVIPLYVTKEQSDHTSPTTLFAIAHTETAHALRADGFEVDRLGSMDPQDTTTYLLGSGGRRGADDHRGNESQPHTSSLNRAWELATIADGVLFALPNDASVEAFHLPGSVTEHARRISPSMALFRGWGTVAPRTTPLAAAAAADPLSCVELAILNCRVEPEFMADTVARYVTLGKLAPHDQFGSRHVLHPGNRIAVDTLVDDLRQIAPERLVVERHCFHHEGKVVSNVIATLPSCGVATGEVVVVSAHLDSIADGVPETAEAPGADDNASGIAAVLGAAHAFVELTSLGRKHREVKFILFNCEEVGRGGSNTYATAQAALGTSVAAMFHMDMIGYTSKPKPEFEVHAGYATLGAANAKAAAARSIEQVELIKHLRPIVTNLHGVQTFTDRFDIGASRSDHSMFHGAGYPGCWVTQDFFPEQEPSGDLNPAYHTRYDSRIMADYATQIARLVAAAAWIAATR